MDDERRAKSKVKIPFDLRNKYNRYVDLEHNVKSTT